MKDTQEHITAKSKFAAYKILDYDRVLRCEIKINQDDEEFLEIDYNIKGTTIEESDKLVEFIKVFKINAYINYVE